MHKERREREQGGMGTVEPCAPIKNIGHDASDGEKDRGIGKRTCRGAEPRWKTRRCIIAKQGEYVEAAPGKVNEACRVVALPLVCYVQSHQSLEFVKRLDGQLWRIRYHLIIGTKTSLYVKTCH